MKNQPKAQNQIEKFISKYYDTKYLIKWIKTHLLIVALVCFGLLLWNLINELLKPFIK